MYKSKYSYISVNVFIIQIRCNNNNHYFLTLNRATWAHILCPWVIIAL